jgi:translation initiation factor 2B subunit (eIF-2B alpha/beta/delta family)
MASREEREELIKEIAEDKVHGADWLSNRALEIIRDVALEAPVGDEKELMNLVRGTARRLAASRPSMASLTNKVSKLVYQIIQDEREVEELREDVASMVRNLLNDYRRYKRASIEKAADYLRSFDTFITLSYSSTVLNVLDLTIPKKVIVGESRPLFEGRQLAKELANRGLGVTLVIDAAMAKFVESADAAIVGADSVLPDGSVINKIGTKLLALAAEETLTPLYVICDTSKFHVRSFLGEPPKLEEKDSSEVAEGLEGVDIRNPYFEITEGGYISRIITEDGAKKPQNLKEKFGEMEKYVKTLIGY